MGIFTAYPDAFICCIAFILAVRVVFARKFIMLKGRLLVLLVLLNTFLIMSLLSPIVIGLEIDVSRFFVSCIAVNSVIFATFQILPRLSRDGLIHFSDICKRFSFFSLFLMILVIQLSKVFHFKHYFGFTEISHFALCGSPIFVYTFLNLSNFSSRAFFIFLLLVIGLSTPNTTIVALAILCLLITLSLSNILNYVVILFCLYYLTIMVDFDYFSNRILSLVSSDADTQNTSGLVYIQGWEFCLQLIKKGILFGVGFQQMGNSQLLFSDTSFIIERLTGEFLSYKDGSFLFSKLFVEFGILFLLLFSKVIWNFVRSKNTRSLKFSDPINSLFVSSYYGFFFVLFVRGMGYFNFAVFWFILTVFISKLILVSEKGIYNLSSHS